MVEIETEVIDIIKRTDSVKSFRFGIKEDAYFKPGQFFFVTIKINGEERAKHFSFSNSPTEKGYIEFTKRITRSPFSQALDSMKAGDWAKLKMPLGSFTFEGEYEKIAFLSGGIGITPIRSICKFVTDKGLPTDIVLLYSNRREEDIIFKNDFDNMRRANGNIRVVYTLTTDADGKAWSGRIGYIEEGSIKEEIQDYHDRVFYICGPPKMVKSMRDILNKMGINTSNIKTEDFTGY